jgi:hypothetical protein
MPMYEKKVKRITGTATSKSAPKKPTMPAKPSANIAKMPAKKAAVKPMKKAVKSMKKMGGMY